MSLTDLAIGAWPDVVGVAELRRVSDDKLLGTVEVPLSVRILRNPYGAGVTARSCVTQTVDIPATGTGRAHIRIHFKDDAACLVVLEPTFNVVAGETLVRLTAPTQP